MTLLLLFSGLAEGHLLEIVGKEISENCKLEVWVHTGLRSICNTGHTAGFSGLIQSARTGTVDKGQSVV